MLRRAGDRFLSPLLLLIALAIGCVADGALAQHVAAARAAPLEAPLPMDPSILRGRFDSGLRYFVRHNAEPRNRAYLRLVVNVGSLHEAEDERGVAHFLEHMAFNGTEHFAKQSLVRFMESIGMRLGPGINASTSYEQTIYKLTLPADVPEHMETALRIIEDWIQGVSFDPAEVDLERGVVLEEWRASQGVQARVREQYLPVLLNGSRYAERLPIGTAESINAIDAAKLRRFYRQWYRPERMAVIAVGDFDAARMERLIRDRFATLPAAPGPSPADPNGDVPEHSGTLYSIVTDAELQTQSLQIVQKIPADLESTHGAYRRRRVQQVGDGLLKLRLQEKVLSADAPFLAATADQTNLTRTVQAHVLGAAVAPGGIERGLSGIQAEAVRVARHGFTETELERARANFLRTAQVSYANRDKLPSEMFASDLTAAFLIDVPVLAVDYEFALLERVVPQIGLDEINALARGWTDERNRVVLVTMPRQDGLAVPQAATLASVLRDTQNADLVRYVDPATPTALLDAPPRGAPVVSTRQQAGDVIEWRLGNGVRVVLKRTDFSEDLVLFRGFLPGGTSLADDDALTAAGTAAGIASIGGLGAMDLPALRRVLNGKVAEVRVDFGEFESSLVGRAATSDLRTLFELIYLRCTEPRADPATFALVQNQLRLELENRDKSPETRLADTVNRLLSADHPRARPLTADRLGEMNLERSLAFYRERFADATGATFIFIGNFDIESMQPLVEQYLGGLPAAGRSETVRDRGVRVPAGVFQETVRAGREPKSTTVLAFNGEIDVADPTQRTWLAATAQLLQIHLRDVLREELGGTYSVSVEPRLRWLPVAGYSMVLNFSSAPERAGELLERIFQELAGLAQTGPTADRVADVRAVLLRAHETNLRRNDRWLAALADSYRYDARPGADQLLSVPDRVNALTAETVRAALQRYLRTDNYIRVTLLPAE